MLTSDERQTILDDCIRVLHNQLQSGPANIQVSSAKELLALLSAKEDLTQDQKQEARPLFGDLFEWRKKNHGTL